MDPHWHCANGCEKAIGRELSPGYVICHWCEGPWMLCDETICPEHAEAADE